MIKYNADTVIENIAYKAEGLASTLGILGSEAQSYSPHLGKTVFLMQTVSQQIADELYKIFDELRGGGKWFGRLKQCGGLACIKRFIAQEVMP